MIFLAYNQFLNEVKKIIQPVLKPRGYLLSPPPITRRSMIWFVKKTQLNDPLYRIIAFQPDGISRKEIFRVAINLQRRSYYDFDNPPAGVIQKEYLDERLAPWLWEEKSNVIDYWWYVNSREELADNLNDILAKIINYGIPFLEDINSTQMSWFKD